MAVEKAGGGRSTRSANHVASSATTCHQSDFSKPVELPRGPINSPYGGNEDTPHFRDSTCKALVLSVVGRL
jgi:hypothetical protein